MAEETREASMVGECSQHLEKNEEADDTETTFELEYFEHPVAGEANCGDSDGDCVLAVAEEIEGQRRGSNLVMAGGYLYRRNYRNIKNDKNYLLCNQRYEQPYCYARAIMQSGLVKLTKSHNHLPDPIKVEQLRIKSRCKKRAEEETTSIREIVEEEQATGSLDVHPNFYGTLAKRRKSMMPLVPKSVDQFIQLLQENEDRYCNPANSSLFFSGFITADDFSVATFICPSFNEVLDDVEVIHLDHMYSAIPALYNHLCTLLITVNNHVYPLVYGLMTSDSEASYTILFTFIKQQIPNLEFKLAILDYHPPIHSALKSAYPLADACGGYIHYAMAVWREVQVKTLVNDYTENRDIQMCIRMLLSLPLLPPEFVDSGISCLGEKILELDSCQEPLQEILDYIHHCWLDHLGASQFSVADEPQRSSLDVDAHLTKMKNKLGNSAGNIWQFIDRLKSFQESEKKDFDKLMQGNPSRKRSGCVTSNSKVRDVIEKLKTNKLQVGEVLSSMAMQLQPPTNFSMEMYMQVHQERVVPLFRPVFHIVSVSEIQPGDCTSDVE